jgi:riboflavin kinase/FMN adenylyltransferase
VHLGHQAVLRHLVGRARALETVPVAMTFEPHPVKLLRPDEAPRLLSTLDQRLQLIAREGIEVCLVVEFTRELARMSAEDFIRSVLVDRLAIQEVYIGRSFRFGADRGGSVDLLVRRGQELGFSAGAARPVRVQGEVVSSSRVRHEVAAGRVGTAWSLLGRPVFLDGTVVRGRRLGRTLGFPTANLEPANELLPRPGVFVSAIQLPETGRVLGSVTNIGTRPTVGGGGSCSVETHVLDIDEDLYDQPVRLFLLDRLRDERSFASLDELAGQISRDTGQARAWLARHRLDRIELVLRPS